MTLCPSASRLPLVHPLTLLPLHHSHILPLPLLFSSLSPSIWLSFRLSLPGCRVSLHINRTLVTAFSASSCLLSPSRCSISSIMSLHPHTPLHHSFFLPPVPSIRLCLPFSHHLPLFRFVLPVLCPVCLNYLQYLSPKPSLLPFPFFLHGHPPFLSPCPVSHPSSPVLWIVEAASSSCSSLPHHIPPLYSSVPLLSPAIHSSLSISLSAIDGGAGCWPKTRRGLKRGLPVCPFLWLSLLFLFLSVCPSQDLPFLPVFLCMSSPFRQHSLRCHSAVCLYFPCRQPFAWPEWQPWQLKHCVGPLFSLWNTSRERDGSWDKRITVVERGRV